MSAPIIFAFRQSDLKDLVSRNDCKEVIFSLYTSFESGEGATYACAKGLNDFGNTITEELVKIACPYPPGWNYIHGEAGLIKHNQISDLAPRFKLKKEDVKDILDLNKLKRNDTIQTPLFLEASLEGSVLKTYMMLRALSENEKDTILEKKANSF